MRHTLDFLADLQLIPDADCHRMRWLFDAEFPFRSQLEAADSLHVHVKVADTSTLPDDAIVNAEGRPENRQAGYVKYAFPAGVNVIFSSIPVAEEDRLPNAQRITRPVLDHVGFDLRKESDSVRRRFDAVTEVAARNGWRAVGQGGGARPVLCCHTQVNEKRWAYPPSGFASWTRPLEFAFAPLLVTEASMGCDLPSIDPSAARSRNVRRNRRYRQRWLQRAAHRPPTLDPKAVLKRLPGNIRIASTRERQKLAPSRCARKG
ncbi:MAG: hypothetical protein ABIR62_14800 [Dokdonella sp.]|uniref:hypothetical protein n=1 Tax=Dokdonella sp. TaxID=2291710 RepID=UPI003264F82F